MRLPMPLARWPRRALLAGLGVALLRPAAAQSPDALAAAMRQAEALRDAALRSGDQPYGAVVLRGDALVGAAPSRVVAAQDPSAHAEREALRDALRRLQADTLAGCVLVSTSRPCGACEAAAAAAGIVRMVYGPALSDAGAPR
jgi:tRNA(Arg) A34 adenosine deaminase TadA